MANEKNLEKGKATQFQSGEKAARNGQKGGKKSGESKRQKKLLKECMNSLLDVDIKDKKVLKKLTELGIDDTSNKMLITLGLFNAATYGDVKAFKEIRNLIGEDKRDVDLGKIDEIIGVIDDVAAE